MTFRSNSGVTCEFQVDWFPFTAQLSLMRILIPATLAIRSTSWEPNTQLADLTVEVSNDTLSWEQVATGSSAAPFATGWTELNIASPNKNRYLRVRIRKSDNSCIIPEVEFIGVTQPLTGPAFCDIAITASSWSGNVTIRQAGSYSYSEAVTPVVTSVSPQFGSASGGTVITVSGENLPESPKDAVVEVDGILCVTLSASSTELTCVTGERLSIPESTSFTVSSLSHGAAMTGANSYAYKDRWSSRVTWAGVIYTS